MDEYHPIENKIFRAFCGYSTYGSTYLPKVE
jgi:hypothetical protein